jgi:hypothetical protein
MPWGMFILRPRPCLRARRFLELPRHAADGITRSRELLARNALWGFAVICSDTLEVLVFIGAIEPT